MSAFRDVVSRRRQDLNPLMTSMGTPQRQLPTPASAAGLSSQFALNYPTQQPVYTPISGTHEYNPQQWNGNAVSTAQYSPGALDPIPPPYSPPRSNRLTTASPQDVPPDAISRADRTTMAAVSRPLPEIVNNPSFPPPPGMQTRGNSRDSGVARFNLALGRRQAAVGQARGSPGIDCDNAAQVRRPAPAPLMVEPFQAESSAAAATDIQPPASRRAISAGGVGAPTQVRTRSSSASRWEPGMPLPPPPPGPPPPGTGSRSQSLTRAADNTVFPTMRRPQASSLGPVPPTPADWVEDNSIELKSPPPKTSRGLQLNTANLGLNASTDPGSQPGTASEPAGLSRSSAVRGESRSIRERRSESRTGRSAHPDQASNNPWAGAVVVTPSDITVPPNTILGRRPAVTWNTPRSARSTQDAPSSSRSTGTPQLLENASRGSTPRALPSAHKIGVLTPPFSPERQAQIDGKTTHSMSRSTPDTPPSRSAATTSRQTHLFNKSINEHMTSLQHSPAYSTHRHPLLSHSSSAETFSNEALRRHADFVQREAVAGTDEERVRLFADFIVTESRIRRQRYASAMDMMGSETLELTRDLFRPYADRERKASASFSSTTSSRADNSAGRTTPLSDSRPGSRQDSAPTSASDEQAKSQGRPDSAWFNTYLPSLSPIESVAHQSSKADESSSRGRPSSRWWEVDAGSNGSQGGKIERTKRESKYMGHLRESLQWDDSGALSRNGTPRGASSAGPSSQELYAQNEYPDEKVGWHEDGSTNNPGNIPRSIALSPRSPPIATPPANCLDVSRLVTLPPPYPRHHPAVNNSHPDLTTIREQVRGLNDLKDIETRKQRYNKAEESLVEQHKEASSKRRNSFRLGLQRNIEAGTMNYSDAAKAEEDFNSNENDLLRTQSKTSFELFQREVVGPLNDLLMANIDKANTLSATLASQITAEAQDSSHDTTQEEGDEQPELLEKLTLLKWIFEAREQLHRELYVLLSERNGRYKAVVILPYQLAGNDAKMLGAEQFFKADELKRGLDFEKETLERTTAFLDTIETHVTSGVEIQLSAFWDIAPSLSQILGKIPKPIGRDFSIRIPDEEYLENPEYREWPMQYLYSLLEHGERSTYQFIESQINLLCLLHEVKSMLQIARSRHEDAEWRLACPPDDALQARIEDAKMKRREEEQRLTDDLKDKVKVVEDLWTSALGKEMDEVKSRVKEFLINEDGWEGMERES